ncbi:hypothetical protein PGTUg99_032438 [Puccinia graminis f. sp. tritici]|uniref:Putative 5'-nucleotidase C-terminal domain-containing protein n=1 Tax=Puccinia graminis f. sp. tritici TaxID=56615 RepID=A0A5B0R7I3_PUCGR|nr:hypothetical protein PGTUg99_032438 [Puccinia graminis f. sp. tritici]
MGNTAIDAFRHFLILGTLIWNSRHALGCNDGLHKRSQPSATPPPGAPNRQLEWGDLNILHTTDSHGHLKSEQPEPNYSGDFGDFHSFVRSMKEKATQKGVDLLVVDSGDLHDGNGLCDAEPYVHPGTPRGTTSTKIFTRVPYDILAIGNHELYDPAIAQNMHDDFAPSWNGSYLTSNVNITTSGTSVPLGSRYRKLVTEHGRRVTAFGILFHFTGNAHGTTVQPPSEMILEPWFKEAIQDKPDLFLLAGHMGIRDSDWKRVFKTIRAIHPEVPIIILGGHYHIRDCQQLDDRSMSLASGRYMETLGWMSLSGLDKPAEKPNFSRRYLDANRLTYQFHAGDQFDTIEGVQTTERLTKAAQEFDIDRKFGVAPHSYYGYRVPPTSDESLGYLFTGPEGVLQTVVKDPGRKNPMLAFVHSTSLRADLYAGNFTVNDQFITMPFNNSFQYFPDVPRVTADKVLGVLNGKSPAQDDAQSSQMKRHLETKEGLPRDESFHLGHDVDQHYLDWIRLQSEDHHHELSARSTNQTPSTSYGYVTKDECPDDGDDVIHTPVPFVRQTPYVATTIPDDSADLIDVVFDSFIAKFLLVAINKARAMNATSTDDRTENYTRDDIKEYNPVKSNEILGIYAQSKWNN